MKLSISVGTGEGTQEDQKFKVIVKLSVSVGAREGTQEGQKFKVIFCDTASSRLDV